MVQKLGFESAEAAGVVRDKYVPCQWYFGALRLMPFSGPLGHYEPAASRVKSDSPQICVPVVAGADISRGTTAQ